MLTLLIAILGAATVYLSLSVAIEFRRHVGAAAANRLAGALTWQLWGEAIIGTGTLLFAVAAHLGWLQVWSDGVQSTIRFLMFGATSATTLHLRLTLRSILSGRYVERAPARACPHCGRLPE